VVGAAIAWRGLMARFGRRVPPVVWLTVAALLLVLTVALEAALGDARGPGPSTVSILATATPAPTFTATPNPYRGSLTDLALRFDVEEAMAHAEELASDAYAGRQGGSPGGRRAAEYIARQFEALGLEPAGTDGYFQPLMLPYAEEAGVPTLVITDAAGTAHDDLVFAEDFRHTLGGGAAGGDAEGTVLWLGQCGPSDYDAHDTSGQIVMCRDLQGVDHATRAASEGAEALLLVTSDERRIATRHALADVPQADGIPTLLISSDVAALLLGAGGPSRDLGPLEATAHVVVDLARAGEAEGANVLAVLAACDPASSDRALIIGAHYDHLGSDPNGAVYYGANDNASGVAVLLATARSWREVNYCPSADVLFAAWDGEEQGLLGAKHYVVNPRYPLTATIGMIQLDMVGMAAAGTLTYDGEGNPVGDQLAASAALYGVPAATADWEGGSDHGAFLDAGVDAGLLIWDAAEVPYYHTPQDTVDTLQPERLRQAGIVASHAALMLIRGAEATVARYGGCGAMALSPRVAPRAGRSPAAG